MTEIYIFSDLDGNNDYSTMGLAGGPLRPTQCVFSETKNGESILELSHPIDEYGQYKTLEKDRILVVPVPVYNYGGIQEGHGENVYEKESYFRVKSVIGEFVLGSDILGGSKLPAVSKTAHVQAGDVYDINGTWTDVTFTSANVSVMSYIITDASGTGTFEVPSSVLTAGQKATLKFYLTNSAYQKSITVCVLGTTKNLYSSKTVSAPIEGGKTYTIKGYSYCSSAEVLYSAEKVTISDSIYEPKSTGSLLFTTKTTDITVIPISFPAIQNGTVKAASWMYVLSQTANAKKRTVYKNYNGKGKAGTIPAIDSKTKQLPLVHVVSRLNSDYYKKSVEHPFKIEYEKVKGYMDEDAFQAEPRITYNKGDNSASIISEQTRWQIKNQYFRIYEVEKSLTEVKVSARHISYDLMYNVTRYRKEGETSLLSAIRGILSDTNTFANHDFNAYSNLLDMRAGLEYRGINPINAFLDETTGICALYNADIVRDNYDLVFMNDAGQNRGIRIEYGKNLSGVTYKVSTDKVVTRIVPFSKNKDKTTLYLKEDDCYVAATDKAYGNATVDSYMTYDLTGTYHSIWFAPTDTSLTGYWLYHENSSYGPKFSTPPSTWSPVDKDNNPTKGKMTYNYDYHLELGLKKIDKTVPKPTGVTVKGRPYIDSPKHFNDYPIAHISYLDCSTYTVGEKVNDTKVTVDSAREYMLKTSVEAFTAEKSKIDQPEYSVSVQFQNLGETEEYSQFKDLENCFLYDYITLIVPMHSISAQLQIIKIQWDVLLQRMKSIELGTPSATLATCIGRKNAVISGSEGYSVSLSRYFCNLKKTGTAVKADLLKGKDYRIYSLDDDDTIIHGTLVQASATFDISGPASGVDIPKGTYTKVNGTLTMNKSVIHPRIMLMKTVNRVLVDDYEVQQSSYTGSVSVDISVTGSYNGAILPCSIDVSQIESYGGAVTASYNSTSQILTISVNSNMQETNKLQIPVVVTNNGIGHQVMKDFTIYVAYVDPWEENYTIDITQAEADIFDENGEKVHVTSMKAHVYNASGEELTESDIADIGRVVWYVEEEPVKTGLDYSISMNMVTAETRISAKLER